jgi:hypothetical protein
MAEEHPFGADPPDSYEDLAWFDEQYKPEASKFRPGLETLPDGSYDFEIVDAEIKKSAKKQVRILELGLKVNGGAVVQHAYFLDTVEKMNRLGGDLCVLGIPADKWGKAGGVSVAVGLPEAVRQLPGIKFRGAKDHNTPNAAPGQTPKTFHNLRILCRVAGTPAPVPAGPNGNGREPFNEFAPASQPTPASAPKSEEPPW